ncbi:S1 RNA-binding domain-containing protein [Spirillospora sp. NPDC052242]
MGRVESVRVGDVVSGTVVAFERGAGGIVVRLDGELAPVRATIGELDLTWSRRGDADARIGRRVTAEVIAVDAERGSVVLSTAATAHPELWAFLKARKRGEVLGGTVADVQNFGVFVALDDCPPHPIYPGVGFVTIPELSWRRFDAPTDVVAVGERVRGEFLQFDTWNGEARMSLRALLPDPLQALADAFAGGPITGRVTKIVPFGVFVEVADGVEGLLHVDELGTDRPDGFARVGDDVEVVVIEVDRVRRRVRLGTGGRALPRR